MVALAASSSRALSAASQAETPYVTAPFPTLHFVFRFLLGPPAFQAAYPWVLAWCLIGITGASTTFNVITANCCMGFVGNLLVGLLLLMFIGLFFFLRQALHASSRDLESTVRAYLRQDSKSVNGVPLRFVPIDEWRRDALYVYGGLGLSSLLPICTLVIISIHANNIFKSSREKADISYEESVFTAGMTIIAPVVVLLVMVTTSGGYAVAVVHRRRLMHLEELLSERSLATLVEVASLDVAPIEVRSVLARPPSDVGAGCTSLTSHVRRLCGISRRSMQVESIVVTSPLSAFRPGKAAEGAAAPQNVQVEDFLSVYHSVRREMHISALWWTAPIIVAACCTIIFVAQVSLRVITEIITGRKLNDVVTSACFSVVS